MAGLHHIAKKSKKIEAYKQGIEDLEAYLSLPKFHDLAPTGIEKQGGRY